MNRHIFVAHILLVLTSFLTAQEIKVQAVNTETVGLYEKFEIEIQLTGAIYSNPYDPKQIDIQANFTAPSGKVWKISAFYDNYQNCNKWKVRFSPNEAGEWAYFLKAKDTQNAFESPRYGFSASESAYHGWLKVSAKNPHYFEQDDGTPFYLVGPYYPWQVTNGASGLGKLEQSGCNFFGYWNIMYDTGEIIESINSGLGRYDQPKCGRIDQVLGWAEDRNLKMMLAIWPHDLLSNTVWAHQWHKNPYKEICSVEEFFESDTAWHYQEMQYRYIIARWGYSRSMGIWEIVNEINGTDGWESGKTEEARLWVKRVHNYFKENDPYKRPTTASKSGGHYWTEGYNEVDIPNVHVYEKDWAAPFPGNPLRSSLWVYYNLSTDFWNDFEKPAIFGEAGYTNSFGNFAPGSADYLSMFHNAVWVSWAGGMSGTPVWWAFSSREIMNDEVMEQLHSFSKIAKAYNYIAEDYERIATHSDNADIFVMQGNSSMFGWAREIYGNAIGGKTLRIPVENDTTFQVQWINTWTGEALQRAFVSAVDSELLLETPRFYETHADIAFMIEQDREGETPVKLKLQGESLKTHINSDLGIKINCLLLDAENRFCRDSGVALEFTLTGPGTLYGDTKTSTQNGLASIVYYPTDEAGEAIIIARSATLTSDTILINVSDKIQLDDFEVYQTNKSLQYVWAHKSGTTTAFYLENRHVGQGENALKIDYTIGNGHAPYAGIERKLEENYKDTRGIGFWLKGDNSHRQLALLLFEKNGRYWQFNHTLDGMEAKKMQVPFDAFSATDGSTGLDPARINKMSLNILKGDGAYGSGHIIVDDIFFYLSNPPTEVSDLPEKVNDFYITSNYPNPFNNATKIRYFLPTHAKVHVNIYDTQGKLVEKLLNKKQTAGLHEIFWRPDNLASGMFILQISAGKNIESQKCLLLK